jgi:hypothetical protein
MMGDTKVCDVASQLVTGVAAALNADTAPDSLNIVRYQFGEVAWDNCQCGLAALTINRIFTSREFPIDTSRQRVGNCDVGYMVVDASLVIVRCVPVEGDDSNNALVTPPKSADVEAAARRAFRDQNVAWTTLSCQLSALFDANQVAEWLMCDAVVLGPLGGCGGVQVNFYYAFTRDCACP